MSRNSQACCEDSDTPRPTVTREQQCVQVDTSDTCDQLYRGHGSTLECWNIRSQDYSFPRPNITRKIHSLDYNRSNTSFIVYVK